MRRLSIVADQMIWGVREAFSSLPGFEVDLTILEGAKIEAKHLDRADILLTRSKTKVNEALLKKSAIQFAATATIGDDHYDKAWLDQQGISWATAAGSSTESVVEYVLASLFELHRQKKIDLLNMTLGIVGVGRIGGLLGKVCKNLGIRVLCNDPPLQRETGAAEFIPLDQLLVQADVLSLHTPLIRDGLDQTEHLLGSTELAQFQGCGIINAARGECLDNIALLEWLDGCKGAFTVLDCWENEPNIHQDLLAHPNCLVATPHIAGHSLDGKAANTQYIYDALCQFLSIKPIWNASAALPKISSCNGFTKAKYLNDWVEQGLDLYPILKDHDALRSILLKPKSERASSFVSLRRDYPVRRSWSKQSSQWAQLFE
ncbi:MAG: 4-phosphoerythronate dehydrogenase [Mariprofundaceae bacterium]